MPADSQALSKVACVAALAFFSLSLPHLLCPGLVLSLSFSVSLSPSLVLSPSFSLSFITQLCISQR